MTDTISKRADRIKAGDIVKGYGIVEDVDFDKFDRVRLSFNDDTSVLFLDPHETVAVRR